MARQRQDRICLSEIMNAVLAPSEESGDCHMPAGALTSLLKCGGALVGAFSGALAGALAARATRTPMVRGAGVGALAGAIVAGDALAALLGKGGPALPPRPPQQLELAPCPPAAPPPEPQQQQPQPREEDASTAGLLVGTLESQAVAREQQLEKEHSPAEAAELSVATLDTRAADMEEQSVEERSGVVEADLAQADAVKEGHPLTAAAAVPAPIPSSAASLAPKAALTVAPAPAEVTPLPPPAQQAAEPPPAPPGVRVPRVIRPRELKGEQQPFYSSPVSTLSLAQLDGQRVVVKCPQPEDFEKELATLCALPPSPCFLSLCGTVQRSDRTRALVLPYAEGGMLTEAVKPGPDCIRSLLELVGVLARLARAFDDMHQRAGRLHRDIKGYNILLDATRRCPIIADFGTAREVGPSGRYEGPPAVGTGVFRAPETYEGIYSLATEVFSMGWLMIEAVVGFPICDGDKRENLSLPPEYKRKHNEQEYAYLQLVRKCLRIDPAERYQSMGELAEALEHFAARFAAAPEVLLPWHREVAPQWGPKQGA